MDVYKRSYNSKTYEAETWISIQMMNLCAPIAFAEPVVITAVVKAVVALVVTTVQEKQ